MTDTELREKARAALKQAHETGFAEEAVAAALREVAEEAVKASRPEFKELAGTEIPADELAAAKEFAEFDGKEQMMCGWQSIHRELHVIYHALLKTEAELAALKAPVSDEEERQALRRTENGFSSKMATTIKKTLIQDGEVLARLLRQRTAALKDALENSKAELEKRA